MQSFQSRVINRIEQEIERHGLEVSISQNFSNTGSIYGHAEGGISPLIQIGYNFQPGSYNLTITVGDRRVPSQVGRADYFDFYHPTPTDQTRFWQCLADELQQLRRKPKPKR